MLNHESNSRKRVREKVRERANLLWKKLSFHVFPFLACAFRNHLKVITREVIIDAKPAD